MSEVYCGPAPTPEGLNGSWNPDATALLLCVAATGLHVTLRPGGGRLPLFGAVALFAVLFISPLCALTVALFSARSLHHVLLVAAVAPLLACAFPARSKVTETVGIGWIASLHAAVFWLWHAPPVYAVAIADPAAYWTMQLSLLISGCWLWRRILDRREGIAGVMLALLGTSVQMGMLGALLTFAATPLYAPHLPTTAAFGLSPLQDQQLAGLVMWVPAALPYLAAALIRAWPLLGRPGGSASWSG